MARTPDFGDQAAVSGLLDPRKGIDHMKNVRLLLLLLAIVVIAPAYAQGVEQVGSGAETDPEWLFQRLDRNNDGQLTPDELSERRQRLRNNFDVVDGDGDGGISLKELQNVMSRGGQRSGQPESQSPPGPTSLFDSRLPALVPASLAESRVTANGENACALNPEFSDDGSLALSLVPSGSSQFSVEVRTVQPDGNLGDVVNCPVMRTTLFMRPGDWSTDPLGRPYFVYGDASTNLLKRVQLEQSGGKFTCTVDDNFLYGPVPKGEVWRSIFAYTEPKAEGRSYVYFLASDSPSANRSRWVEIRVIGIDDVTGAISSENVVERQAWDEGCGFLCKRKWGGLLPLDKVYIRWITGSNDASLLFGSTRHPMNIGKHDDELPPEMRRADAATGKREWVSDSKIYNTGLYSYDAGNEVVASKDTGTSLAFYDKDPNSGYYKLKKSVATDIRKSKLSEPENGRIIDIEPFKVRGNWYVVYHFIDKRASIIRGLSEVWLADKATGTTLPISGSVSGSAHHFEPEPVISPDGTTARIYYSSYAADARNPWDGGTCHELWRVDLKF